jgi:hypothetical protein
VLAVVGAEGERRAPEYDPHQHQRKRNVQHGAQPGVDRGKTGESEDYRQNQPDVVRLPDRTERVGDDFALALAPPAGREQVPDTATEVGSPEQDVCIQ